MQRLTRLLNQFNIFGKKLPVETEQLIARAAQLLHDAHHSVAFTGAGISTASGIPDFRSPRTGLWEDVDEMDVASIQGFLKNPQRFYGWLEPLALRALRARPNVAHLALAHLERIGKLEAIITQNIDNLHTVAGSRHVYEIHGHLREMRCTQCGRQYDSSPLFDDFLAHGHLPFCDCGAVLRPSVTLFGEQLPQDILLAARYHALHSDLLLVAGSSLSVFPAADFPAYAQRTGAKLIIVNLTPTPFDDVADVVIHANVTDILPRLAAAAG